LQPGALASSLGTALVASSPPQPALGEQGKWEAVVLPAWDGSKTALAGSESGFGRPKVWRFTPIQAYIAIRNRQWQPLPVYHKKLPKALVLSLPGTGDTAHRAGG
jgi:hypothetical protein